MPNIYLVKTEAGDIIPSTLEDHEYFRKKKPGAVLKAKISEPRSGQFHRLYFALLNVAFQNQEKYNNFEDFRTECQLRAGHYREHITLKGKVVYVPLSIAYGKLDNDEFGELYQEVLDVILKYFIKGSTEQEIDQEVQKYLGFM